MTVQINEIFSKKILTEATGYLDIGFTHSLNPYSGCTFACKYCYVRELPVQRFKGIPWGQWVDLKTNAAELYRKEIMSLRRRNKPVNIFMSSATDPYQPVERQVGLTRELLGGMLDHPPDVLQIQTRSPLITRDLDLLVPMKNKCKLMVSMTIETDREDMKRLFAPFAPGINVRLKALKELHDAGLFTQVAVSPVLPFTPDFPEALIGRVDRIWIDTLILGDGMQGKRSERLGMRRLFDEYQLSGWYEPDLHIKVKKYFAKYFPESMIRISKEEAFPQ